jgi:threonine/homoserine/homoserine lactone efflux protein
MSELTAVVIITILAVISPGADFAMVTRNSYLHGRLSGILSSVGIALGVQVHVFYTLIGIGVILTQSPFLYNLIKIIGALYLIYIGYKTFNTRVNIDLNDKNYPSKTGYSSILNGFVTNAMNPKTTMFVISVFTQVVSHDTALKLQIFYGSFMSLAHLVWFALIALFFSSPLLRTAMLRKQGVINGTIGSVLITLGSMLALSPVVN